jgi:hypothetical protein
MSRPDHRLDHRLDDELRDAFRREQPSADFTMRVLERVSLEPSPRLRWWQRLAMLLEPPKLRWVAIGVTASLLLAIGVMQYSRLHQGVVNNGETVAESGPSREANDNHAATTENNPASQNATIATPKPTQDIKRPNHRLALARHEEERELRAEGEAAKEKLMLALSIASSALSDAQKAVHDDGVQP